MSAVVTAGRTPSDELLKTAVRRVEPLPRGLDALVMRAAGAWRRRLGGDLARLAAAADAVVAAGAAWREVTDARLASRLGELRGEVRSGRRAIDDVEVLALVREAARRRLGLEAYPVQVIGALAVVRGFFAEMATGEGKTLTIALAAVPFGWRREPCHVITANDYLARRDAGWLKPLFAFCGASVAPVDSAMEPSARLEAYAADVVYTTAKELVADFLRDRLRLGSMADGGRRLTRYVATGRAPVAGTVTRGIHTGILDEADSLLVDEAVMPVVISQARENAALAEAVRVADEIASSLEEGVHFETDFERRSVKLVPEAAGPVLDAAAARVPATFRGRHWLGQLVDQAMRARLFYHRDRHYVVRDRKVVIVDEFTGRLMPGRTWRHGLHQAVEAREQVPISSPAETLVRQSYQQFFRKFRRLAAVTGTGRESAGELWVTYRMPFVAVPTHRPCRREHLPDRLFAREDQKWEAVVAEVLAFHQSAHRPVLVGTRSVEASENLARRLREAGVGCRLLNAVRTSEEAAIIAAAGRPGTITIATNLAGRGTDIRLGEGVAEAGGLHVVATERHEARRIDRQLFGRAGRQGDPGTARAFTSLDDELFDRFAPGWLRALARGAAARGLPGWRPLAALGLALAQHRAERIGRRQRRAVSRHDEWVDTSLGKRSGEHPT